MRQAMAGRLPERVRTRPKTSLQGDPVSARLRLSGTDVLKEMPWSKDVDRYIERSALIMPHVRMNPEQVSVSLRPYYLNNWLRAWPRVWNKLNAEAADR